MCHHRVDNLFNVVRDAARVEKHDEEAVQVDLVLACRVRAKLGVS